MIKFYMLALLCMGKKARCCPPLVAKSTFSLPLIFSHWFFLSFWSFIYWLKMLLNPWLLGKVIVATIEVQPIKWHRSDVTWVTRRHKTHYSNRSYLRPWITTFLYAYDKFTLWTLTSPLLHLLLPPFSPSLPPPPLPSFFCLCCNTDFGISPLSFPLPPLFGEPGGRRGHPWEARGQWRAHEAH